MEDKKPLAEVVSLLVWVGLVYGPHSDKYKALLKFDFYQKNPKKKAS